MNKSTSLYLDFLRIVSAFAVLIGHLNFSWFSNNLFPGDWGHKFVIIFFVLSGYLIAFTVDHKNKGPEKYLVDRLSRLYSVVLPALVFTYLIDFIGQHYNPTLYAEVVSPDHKFLKFLLNATFLQQVWGLSASPSSNGVFWSISYEFWYYILFWFFCYFKGITKYLGYLAVCLLIGVKILLLFPIWIFGAVIYNYQRKLTISSTLATILFVLTIPLMIGMIFKWDIAFFADRFVFGKKPLFFSSNFVFDCMLGVIVSANIFFFNAINFKIKMWHVVSNLIKYLSSITFSIYLFHLPILVFIAAVVPYNKSSYLQIGFLVAGGILVISFLSQITEHQRGYLKQLLEKYMLPKKA